MADANSDRTFEELLPTLRASCAYLACGRQIMQEVFLWLVGKEDIPNVQDFLIQDQGWTPVQYKKSFSPTTRKFLAGKGIKAADITALWKLFNKVKGFFQERGIAATSVLEQFFYEIKNERNDIVHSLLLQVTHRNQEEIEKYFDSIVKMVDDVIIAFCHEYPGISTDQKQLQLRDFVTRTINDIKEGKTGVGNIQDLALYGDGAGPNIDDEDEDTDFQDASPEDVALDLMTLIRQYAGRTVNLVINNLHGGNVNIQNTGSNNTIHVANITGGQNNIRFG